MERFSDILWLQTSFLGDVVLTTAAFQLVKEYFPGVKQHLITTEVGRLALRDHPSLASITVFSKRQRGLAAFAAVKREIAAAVAGKDGVVLLQPHRSIRSSLLAKYLGYPTIAYEEAPASFLAKRRVPRVMVFHEAVRVALLLEALEVPREKLVKVRPYLPPLELADESWQGALGKFAKPLVGVAPGSVWRTKRWLVPGYNAVVRRLLQDGYGVVILGSKEEEGAASAISKGVGEQPSLWNLAGRTSLDDLRRIFPRLSLLLTNDSSPIHYASAFNTPTVAVFGATVPAMGFSPLADRSVVVENLGLPCRPCSDHGPQTCPLTHFRCMKEITADQVYEACKALL